MVAFDNYHWIHNNTSQFLLTYFLDSIQNTLETAIILSKCRDWISGQLYPLAD
jgi:hypothetical protein